MGYVLFASRKIMLTNQINTYQLELDQIMNEKIRLMNFSAGVADGDASLDDVINDFSNVFNYDTFNTGRNAYISKLQGTITSASATALDNFDAQNTDYNTYITAKLPSNYSSMTPEDQAKKLEELRLEWQTENAASYTNYVKQRLAYKQSIDDSVLNSLGQEYYQNVESKKIAARENELDVKQKRLETKISALQADLQACEQAEAKGIQNATPKYAGLG